MRWRGVAVLAIAHCLAACSPSSASPSSGTSPSPAASVAVRTPEAGAVGCIALPEADCALVESAVTARLAGEGAVSAMLVTAYGGCGEPCPPGLATRPEGDALAEVAGGLARVSWRAAGPATVLVTDASVDQGIRLTPQSGPAAAAAIAFTLGHCGLLSGIDADRSWWDPVGAIPDHPAAMNSADGTLTFTGPASARFRTADGFEVALERHLGAKALPGCM